ncbi:RNA-binding S4 domain-containing protein [Caldisalinibacter kiritimatiensis]|uniref:RQC P-site tRNA stabilizing factor n=1 Tax=Caldisalinibacter kiritimatiensis TaxID=1304284 RepID=R1CDI3_9FIRM|nr:RNA-binding S4 domain-containing protein [Caldisalinibacter kiritimatiensis]EOD00350.1 S4-domain-containing heat shock protein [Caldisalinibacter kiritimatiensis]
MRIDKFLKNSRIIKRRTVAKEACEQGRVLVNNKEAKPGTDVNVGDIIEINFGNRNVTIEVLEILEHVPKDKAQDLYRVIKN